MGRVVYDEFGQRFYEDDSGQVSVAPEAGVLAFAGKQMMDIADNVRLFAGGDEAQLNQRLQQREDLFRGAEAAEPVSSFIGEALPGLATLPITAGGAVANFGLQTGLGALEGALSYDENASAGQRALAGGAGSILGDAAGRVLGRVFTGARGLVQDIVGTRKAAANPDAAAAEAAGLETLAYQRMEQGTPAQLAAQRSAQAAEASANPPASFLANQASNELVINEAVSEAVGLPTGGMPLTREWRGQVLDSFDQQYDSIAQQLDSIGERVPVTEQQARVLSNTTQAKKLNALDGSFDGLQGENPTLSGAEWKMARQVLADDASAAYNAGDNEVGKRLTAAVDALDDQIEAELGSEFGQQYARLREQVRTFKLLERPNVINDKGQVNLKTLDRAVESPTGYGRTATAAGRRETTNPETRRLIDLVDVANKPEFKPFKSSGTAENLAGRELVDDVVEAGVATAQGNVLPALGLGARLQAPAINAMAQKGSGAAFEGLYTPAPQAFVRGGRWTGRSLLDEQLYPFVGVQDDRQQ